MWRRLLAAASGAGSFTLALSMDAPIRASFYFPWYPEGWDQLGYTPFTRYTPTLGAYYDQADPDVVTQHVEWFRYAKSHMISVWRGRDDGEGFSAATFATVQYDTDTKLAALLDEAEAQGIKIAILYEAEGYGTPSTAQVEAELAWLAANRFNHPAYMHVNGVPVVFVYGNPYSRWHDATDGFTTAYVVCIASGQTHANYAEYTFTASRTSTTGTSYIILPGFWRIDEANPRTTRDLATWQSNIASMVASGKTWHIIISFNEWGEGSQCEPEATHGTDYLDALHNV
jgi:hypothetical protein